MPSAAYMGMMMMMMMVVSLSEHAKQPLSLPLPLKVFFSPSFHPSHPVLPTLVSAREYCLCTTIHCHNFFPHIYFFLICPFPAFPSSPSPSLHWYCDRVVVLQFVLAHVVMCCTSCCKQSIGVYPFGSYCCFFLFCFFFTFSQYFSFFFLTVLPFV